MELRSPRHSGHFIAQPEIEQNMSEMITDSLLPDNQSGHRGVSYAIWPSCLHAIVLLAHKICECLPVCDSCDCLNCDCQGIDTNSLQ